MQPVNKPGEPPVESGETAESRFVALLRDNARDETGQVTEVSMLRCIAANATLRHAYAETMLKKREEVYKEVASEALRGLVTDASPGDALKMAYLTTGTALWMVMAMSAVKRGKKKKMPQHA